MESVSSFSLAPDWGISLYSTRFQGSKRRVIPWLLDAISKFAPRPGMAFDAFAGSGVVSFALAQCGWTVTAGDQLLSSLLTCEAFLGASIAPSNESVDLTVEAARAAEPGPIFNEYKNCFYPDEELLWLEGAASAIRSRVRELERAPLYWALFQSALAKRPYNLFHRANLDMRMRNVPRTFGNKATWERPFESHFRTFVQECARVMLTKNRLAGVHHGDPTSWPGSADLIYLDPPYINSKGVPTRYVDYYGFLDVLTAPTLVAATDRSKGHRPIRMGENSWETAEGLRTGVSAMSIAHPDAVVALSYRDDGRPSCEELAHVLSATGRRVSVFHVPVKYALSHSSSSRETLIVAR